MLDVENDSIGQYRDHIILLRALLRPDILRESRYRTSYAYDIVPDQLIRANIHTTLIIPKQKLKEAFLKDAEPLETLDRLKGTRVPIVLLSQPKSQMLIAEGLKVNGKKVARLNRFDASYYTTLWFLRVYAQDAEDVLYSEFAPCVVDVLRALIAYSPKNKEDKSLKYLRNINWQGADEQQTAKELLEWIVERIYPYIPYPLKGYFSDSLNEARPAIEGMLEKTIREMAVNGPDDLEKPSINPFIAIQDFFNFDAFQVFSKPPDSARLASVRVLGAIRRFTEGARRFLSISKELKKAGESHLLRAVIDDIFFIYARLKFLHSTLKCNTKVSDFEWCFEAQAFAWPVIKP